jgi:hypothetical protein
MKSLTFALALAALPLAATADYVERYRTSDGTLVERRYAEPRVVERPYYSTDRVYVDRVYVDPALTPRVVALTPLRGGDAIHTGGYTLADTELANRIGNAIAQDPSMEGVTATIVANNGSVSLSGSAPRHDQGQRAELIARQIAGYGSVSGSIAASGN